MKVWCFEGDFGEEMGRRGEDVLLKFGFSPIIRERGMERDIRLDW